MGRLFKINLKSGLKKSISSLICLSMVLANFPVHMFSGTVLAGDDDETAIELNLANGSDVSSWISDGGHLSNEEKLQNADVINITLSSDINANFSDNTEKMTTGDNGDKYFFDFTDGKFAGKTITIDGKKSDTENYKITISNANLFFLNLKNCAVILKNIDIDGASQERNSAFVNVNQPSKNDGMSYLNIESVNIKNCKNSSGFVIENAGNLSISSGSISDCENTLPNDNKIFISNSGTLILLADMEGEEGTASSFKIGDDEVGYTNFGGYISSDGAKSIVVECYLGEDSTYPFHAKYMGIYPSGAFIDPPNFDGYTFQNLKDSSDNAIAAAEEDGRFQLSDSLFAGNDSTITLKAYFEEIEYKLQYKEAGATDVAITIGEGNGYTLNQLKALADGVSTFESVMKKEEDKLKANPNREFKGWKLGGSTFNLPTTFIDEETGEETKEEVNWETLINDAVQKIDWNTLKIDAKAVKKYFIKFINDDSDDISVTFDGGQDNQKFDALCIEYGDVFGKIIPPSKNYYTFDHWEYGKDSSNSNRPYTATTFGGEAGGLDWTKLLTKVEAGNVILVKAVYKPTTYAIKYKDGDRDAVVGQGTKVH